MGWLLVRGDRGMAAIVGAIPRSATNSSRVSLSTVTSCIEPLCGPADEDCIGFLRRQTRASSLESLCRSVAAFAFAFAPLIDAA